MSRLQKLFASTSRSSTIEGAAALYRRISSIDIVKSGKWISDSRVSVVTEVQDIDNNVKIRKQVGLTLANGLIECDAPGVVVEGKAVQYSSPTNRIVVSVVKTGESFRFDMFTARGLECSIHGAVSQPIADPNLQYLSWLSDESGFVFVGEKSTTKTMKPWEIKATAPPEEISNASMKSTWETKDSWGESFTDNTCFTLYYVNISSGTISDLIDDEFSVDFSAVSPVLLPNSQGGTVLFTGVYHSPRRLGIVYCRNRPSKTFTVSICGEKQVPTHVPSVGNFRGMYNVRVSGDKVAFYSQAREGSTVIKDNYPHNCASSLHVTTVEALLAPSTNPDTFFDDTLVVPVVAETPANPDTDFHGLYPPTGSDLWWVREGAALLVASVARSSVKIFVVDIASKAIDVLGCCAKTKVGQWSILDVRDDKVLLQHSELLRGSSVHVFDLQAGEHLLFPIGDAFPFDDIQDSFTTEVVRVPAAHDSEAIYTYRKGEEERPTLVIVHGGPHSTDTNAFACAQMLYLLQGWNLFSINYGGSLGFGHHRIQELMGEAGANDVADCVACIDAMKARWNPNKLVVYGGSHGGFLSGHLTGRYPDMFKAAIIRNPVINIASSHFETDIPDWNLAVCGVEENKLDIAKMYNMSPIVHANGVKAATLLGLGINDCRVKPHQGRSWYYALKAAPGKPTVRMIEYPDNNHALDGVHAAADFAIRGSVFAAEAL